jgi:transposase
MSTSLLYHAFRIRGYKYSRTEYRNGQVIFTIDQEPETYRCSACGSTQVISRGEVDRCLRSLPIGNHATFVAFAIPRIECRSCGLVRQVDVSFADPRRSYTKAFERYALELSRSMTIRDVARHLNVGWDLIKDIQKRDLSRRYAKPKLKGADALKPFWKRLRPSGARVEAVAMDMSAGYWGAVMTHLPKAKIVFDHFHVIKLFNDRLSDLRRALYREATDVMQKAVLKGTRWLLLKNPENLDKEKDEKQRLKEALTLNQPLATAYYLKDDLRRFWNQPGKAFATSFLNGWIRRAEASGIKILQQMAKTLAAHRTGLLAYYDVMISSGPMEGTNNKIKTMKRQAYGFRDMEFFKLKILAIHETRHALVG